MRQINTFQQGTASGNIARLQKPIDGFDKGNICTRMRFEAAVTLANSSTNYTLTNANALALMGAIFATWSLSFGDRAKDNVDDSVSFFLMRAFCIVMTGRDFSFNGVQLYAYTSSSNGFVVPTDSSATVLMEFVRPFVYERFASKLTRWCPGSEQVTQADVSFIRGAAPTIDSGDVTQSGQAQITAFFDNEPGPVSWSRWVRVPRLYWSAQGGLTYDLPGGAILSLFEYTDAAASSPLNFISLRPAGDTALHDEISVSKIVTDAQYLIPLGSLDLNSLVTEMYQTGPGIEHDDLVTSDAFYWKMNTLDLSPAQIAMVYVPAVDLPYSDQIVGPNLTKVFGGECKLSMEHALTGEKIKNPSKASVDCIAAINRQHPKFNSVPGRLYRNGVPPVTHVPETVGNRVRAKIRSVGGHNSAAGSGALATSVVRVSAAIPGGVSPRRRNGGTDVQMGVATNIAKDAVAAHGSAALAGLLKFAAH